MLNASPAAATPVAAVSNPGEDRLAALLSAVSRLADQQRSLLDAIRPPSASSVPTPAPASAQLMAQPYPFAPPPPSAVPGPGAATPLMAQTYPFGPSYPFAPPAAGWSAADLRGVVADVVREHQAAYARASARDAYARDHLADLPDAYRRLLPESGDASALSAAEQDIRRRFREDLRSARQAAGEPGANVGGDAAAGMPPAAAVDYAKLSPLQQIAVGLRATAQAASGTGRGPVGPQSGPEDDSVGGVSYGAD